MSPLELIATLAGLANITLIIRRSVWNYPFALVMVTIYAFIFYGAKLYSDAALQAFFLVINIYGWRSWSANIAAAGALKVERLGQSGWLIWLGGSAIAVLVWGALMHRFTDASYPWWDGSIAMLSIAAQILMTRRYLENWHWWIAVNLISVPLYLIKGLQLTAGLYGIFLVMAGLGLIEWRRAEGKA